MSARSCEGLVTSKAPHLLVDQSPLTMLRITLRYHVTDLPNAVLSLPVRGGRTRFFLATVDIASCCQLCSTQKPPFRKREKRERER